MAVLRKIGSFFKWLGRQFLAFARWVEATFFDIEMSRQIRADLGLDPDGEPTVSLPADAMAGIEAFVKANDPDKAAFAILVEDIGRVAEAIMNLIDTVNTNPNQTRSNQEIFYQFMRIWALQHTRTRVPLVYALARLTGEVQDRFGFVEDLDVDKLKSLVFDTTPDEDEDDEDEEEAPRFDTEDANRYSHLVSFLSLAIQQILATYDLETGFIDAYYGWDPDPSRTPPPPPLQADETVLERAWTFLIGDPESEVGARLLVTFILVPEEHGGPGMVVSLGGRVDLSREKTIEVLDPDTGEPVDQRTTIYSANSTTGGALSVFFPFSGDAPTADGDVLQTFTFSADPKPQPANLNEPVPPAMRIGHRDGTRLDVGTTGYGLDVSSDRIGARAHFKDAELVIVLSEGDSFVSRLPGDDLRLKFDLAVTLDPENGLRLEGGSGLRTTVPISKSPFDALTVHFVSLVLGPSLEADRDVRLAVSTDVTFNIGPVTAVLEEFGFFLDGAIGSGNLGLADVVLGYQPPKGVGLSVKASKIKGGGYLFFDFARKQYSGALELKLGKVSIKAIGILTTELPGGEEGWALLIGLYGQFRLQIGFNFTLLGVGGIVGLQHGLSIDALQAGIRTGILDTLLFPDDPVGNAPRMINQLKTVFPITPRALTLGPFVRLGYNTPSLIELTLGLLLQWDNAINGDDRGADLTRLSVVGRLLIEVPPKAARPKGVKAKLRLMLDFAGSYDEPTDFLSIDARLRDSYIGKLTLTGSFVLRAKGGEEPTFIAAAGGFNPRFKDLPSDLPKQDRLGIKFKKGIAEIRIELYAAKTSNTWQAGIAAFLKAKKFGFTVEASLLIDTLFEEEPVFLFFLDVKITGTLKKGSKTLMEIGVKFALQGPGYWIADGSAKFKVLFLSKTIPFHEEWGDLTSEQAQEIAVGTLVQAALGEPGNWAAQLPATSEQLVTFRAVETGDAVLAHPMGDVTVRQAVVPFALRVDKVRGARPTDGRVFDVTQATIGDEAVTPHPVREHFARASFLDMSHEEKLSAPSFEKLPAGVRFGTDAFEIPDERISAPPEYEVKYRGRATAPHETGVRPDILLGQLAWGAAAQARFGIGEFSGHAAEPVRLHEAPLAVVTVASLEIVEAFAADPTKTYSLVRQAVDDADLQVVELHELEVLE